MKLYFQLDLMDFNVVLIRQILEKSQKKCLKFAKFATKYNQPLDLLRYE
jgi:hypothetical protein